MKPVWKMAQYGCSTSLTLAKVLVLNASYALIAKGEASYYTANAFGHKLKRRFDTLEQAQQAALVLAKKVLGEALAELGEEEQP